MATTADKHMDAALNALRPTQMTVGYSVGLLKCQKWRALDRKDEFRLVTDHRQGVHSYDARGRRQRFSAIPKSQESLTDDPCRSLAAAVCMAGGFPKDQVVQDKAAVHLPGWSGRGAND